MDDTLLQLAKAVADRELAIKRFDQQSIFYLSIEIDKLMKRLPIDQQFVKLGNVCLISLLGATVKLDLNKAVDLATYQIGIPVIYELDEDNEATGQTYRFCSDACAEKFMMEDRPDLDQFHRYTWGREDTAQDNEERCCECDSLIG